MTMLARPKITPAPNGHVMRILTGLTVLAVASGVEAFSQDPLRFSFDGRRGQVEVGGPYAAVEFHESRPVPSRIGFFEPAANSIDLSNDYWKRGESIPFALGITVDSRRYALARESWAYDLSPYAVTFRASDSAAGMSVSYQFGENLPVVVITTTVVNRSRDVLPVEIVSHLAFVLRTCQTYARLDSSIAWVEGRGKMIGASFRETEARTPVVFSRNLVAMPVAWSTDAVAAGIGDDGSHEWDGAASDTGRGRRRSAALFRYTADLHPDDTLRVVQAVGSTVAGDLETVARRLDEDWGSDVAAYEDRVRRPRKERFEFVTGDPWIDRTAAWSRALIEANQHLYAGSLVPMPCPAEYNFVFTHDILLSGLGIVNVDAERVRRDLMWIVDHADGTVIPHACYWRDTSFQTEYCTPSNWNHLWFVMLTARYVRFTHDTATGLRLLPYVERSIRDLLTQVGPDGLVHAPRPDWWDIGWRDGPRAYLTALLSRALEEYTVLRISIGKPGDSLSRYEALSADLRRALIESMWNDEAGYLLDRNGDDLDRHIFAGPLVAAAYGVIEGEKLERLVRTAGERLSAPGVGIRAVMPPDFDEDSVKQYYNIKGHEAGAPYRYINGGVWPHMNAWYAVALQAAGRTEDARKFFRTVMSLDGIAAGPSGTPAMYEYRFSDSSSPQFGTIDKPSFLWAGGFNLYALYRLVGVRDDPWNISFEPRAAAWPSSAASWTVGGRSRLTVRTDPAGGSGIVCDGVPVPSYVLPLEHWGAKSIDLLGNEPARPLLADANVIVRRVWHAERNNALMVECSSFEGHVSSLIIISPLAPRGATVDGHPLKTVRAGGRRWELEFPGSSSPQRLEITF